MSNHWNGQKLKSAVSLRNLKLGQAVIRQPHLKYIIVFLTITITIIGMILITMICVGEKSAEDLTLNLIAEIMGIICTYGFLEHYFNRMREDIRNARNQAKRKTAECLQYARLLKQTDEFLSSLQPFPLQKSSRRGKRPEVIALQQAKQNFEATIDGSADFVDRDTIKVLWPLIEGDLSSIPACSNRVDAESCQYVTQWKNAVVEILNELKSRLKHKLDSNLARQDAEQ